MSARKSRTLRHWKQQYDKNAKFIWRKDFTWQGEPVKSGDPVPDDLFNNKAKLKRFWESKAIELAEFEEPDVATGRVPEAKPEIVYPMTESGLIMPAGEDEMSFCGEVVTLEELTNRIFDDLGVESAEAWNQGGYDAITDICGNWVEENSKEWNEANPRPEEDGVETPTEPVQGDSTDEGSEEAEDGDDLVEQVSERKWKVKATGEEVLGKANAIAKAKEADVDPLEQ